MMLYNILQCFFFSVNDIHLTYRKQNFCVIHISIPKPGTVPGNFQIPNRLCVEWLRVRDSQALHGPLKNLVY